MANTDGPFGLRPIRHMFGGVIRPDEDTIASAYDTSIFTGDLVKRVAGGGIERAGISDANIVGVFAGVHWDATDGEVMFKKYWPADTVTLGSAVAKALVYKDPNILYVVQCNGTITVEDTGQNADTVADHAGSTSTGRSGLEISATTNTMAALQLRIHGLHEVPDNAWGLNANLLVTINESHFTNRTGV